MGVEQNGFKGNFCCSPLQLAIDTFVLRAQTYLSITYTHTHSHSLTHTLSPSLSIFLSLTYPHYLFELSFKNPSLRSYSRNFSFALSILQMGSFIMDSSVSAIKEKKRTEMMILKADAKR
jgi:hypothetical protein